MIGYEDICREILTKYKANDWRITTAESCTAGMISAAITDIPGSSAIFDRGFVTYSYAAKTKMLDVSRDMLIQHGAVSEPVAIQMARGALGASDAQVSIAVTGVAGPGTDGNKAEGLVWFSMESPKGLFSWKKNFGALGRDNVRHETTKEALEALLSVAK